jgi:hypothetical protein
MPLTKWIACVLLTGLLLGPTWPIVLPSTAAEGEVVYGEAGSRLNELLIHMKATEPIS